MEINTDKLIQRGFYSTLSALMAFCFTRVVSTPTIFGFGDFDILVISFVWVAVFTFASYNLYTFGGTILIGVAVGLISVFTFLDGSIIFRPELVTTANNFWFWVYEAFTSYVEPNEEFSSIMLYIVSFGISLLFYLLTIPKPRFWPVIIITMGTFSLLYSQGYFFIQWDFYLYIFLVIMYLLASNFDRTVKLYPGFHPSQLKFLIYTVPMAFFMTLVMLLVPRNVPAADMLWLDRIIVDVTDGIDDTFSFLTGNEGGLFSYSSLRGGSQLGFSTGNLFGNNNRVYNDVMQVRSNHHLYLKGRTYSDYTLDGWVTSDTLEVPRTTEKPFDLEYGELYYSRYLMGLYDVDTPDYELEEVAVTYSRLSTKSLMLPYMPTEISLPNEGFVVYESGNAEVTSGFDDFYSVTYLHHGSSFSMLNSLLWSYEGLYSEIYDDLMSDSPSVMVPEITTLASNIQPLVEYAEVIHNEYTQLDDTIITPEIYALAEQLTQNYDSQYDKVKAIERYLSQGHFSYNIDTRRPPTGEEFLNYFLFERNEGYCVHFATAMTVLCRAVDIPARYVEGFTMPAARDENLLFNVSSENLHSWTEVYFEGVGFVQFEATPANYSMFYNPPLPMDERFVDEYELMMEEMMEEWEYGGGEGLDMPDTSDEDNVGTVVEDEGVSPVVVYFGVLVLTAAVIYMAFNMYNTLWRQRLREAYEAQTKSGDLKYTNMLLKRTMRLFRNVGYMPRIGETFLEFSQRVSRVIPSALPDVREFYSVCTKAFYADILLDKYDKDHLRTFYERYKQHEKNRRGPLYIFPEKLIFSDDNGGQTTNAEVKQG